MLIYYYSFNVYFKCFEHTLSRKMNSKTSKTLISYLYILFMPFRGFSTVLCRQVTNRKLLFYVYKTSYQVNMYPDFLKIQKRMLQDLKYVGDIMFTCYISGMSNITLLLQLVVLTMIMFYWPVLIYRKYINTIHI